MKQFLCAYIFLGMVSIMQAQAPFTGGAQDGYDSGHIPGQSLSTPAVKLSPIEAYPTVVVPGHNLTLKVGEGHYLKEYKIYSLAGQLVQQRSLNGQQMVQIRLKGIEEGSYILVIRTTKMVKRQTFIVIQNPF